MSEWTKAATDEHIEARRAAMAATAPLGGYLHASEHSLILRIDELKAKLEVVQSHYAALESQNFDLTHAVESRDATIAEQSSLINEQANRLVRCGLDLDRGEHTRRIDRDAADRIIADLSRSNDSLSMAVAEQSAILGPKLECCGRYAIEHTEGWNGLDAKFLSCPPPQPLRVTYDFPPEYLAWQKERSRR